MSSGSGIRAKKPAKLNGDIGQQRRRLAAWKRTDYLAPDVPTGLADMNKSIEVVVAFPDASDQKGSAVTRASEELTLDEIAQKLGLTYEEAISAMVRSKHKPPVEP